MKCFIDPFKRRIMCENEQIKDSVLKLIELLSETYTPVAAASDTEVEMMDVNSLLDK